MSAKIAVRAVLPFNKVYGLLSDRFFFGNQVATLDFSVLPLLDSKRVFKFLERKLTPTSYHNNIPYASYSAIALTGNRAAVKVALGMETPINDGSHFPYFYSATQAGMRPMNMGQSTDFPDLYGSFKGPNPVFTVDSQGNAGDFLAPGTKLVASRTGMVHKYVEQGAFGPLTYASNNTTARDAWAGNLAVSNMPVIVGYGPLSASQIHPYYEQFNPNKSMEVATEGTPMVWSSVKFGGFVHQDATYIYFLQICAGWSSGSRYDANNNGAPSKVELIALKKSDGTTTNITLSASLAPSNLTALTTKSVTTTEGTPQKALIYLFASPYSDTKTISLNKVIGTTATNIGTNNFINYFYGETIATQLMENRNASFNTHWKMYFPMAGYNTQAANENALTLQLIRFNKTLLTNLTVTPCTLSGIPTEYCSANGAGTNLRCMNTPKVYTAGRFDVTFAAEVYDGSDQYIAYWIGRTRSSLWTTDVDTFSFSEVTEQSYRWFLVFKVGADDIALTYQSCVPEFKLAKPMYCYAASADNKSIVMANADGLYCFAWSTSTKSFICTDQLSLPGIYSLGMDEVQVAGKGTVFVEVLTTPSDPDSSVSHIYQVDFGDYEDVDIRYYNGTAYITDFGYNTLNLTVDGSNNFTQQTITAEVRVKNKVGVTETAFVTGKTVKLKISGVRETDGCYFVNADVGNPYQKTITTTGDWLAFQFYLQKPLTGGMKITGELV